MGKLLLGNCVYHYVRYCLLFVSPIYLYPYNEELMSSNHICHNQHQIAYYVFVTIFVYTSRCHIWLLYLKIEQVCARIINC